MASDPARRVLLAALVLLGLLAIPADAASKPPPVRVTGTVLNADGTPAAGVAVTTRKQPSLLAFSFTLGFGCLLPQVCFTSSQTVHTDSLGRFTFRWTDTAGQNIAGTHDLYVTGVKGHDGATPAGYTTYDWEEHPIATHAIRLWNPTTSFTRTPTHQLLIHVDPLSPTYGGSISTSTDLVDVKGRTTWALPSTDGYGDTVTDDRIVESGTWGLSTTSAVTPSGAPRQYLTSAPHPIGPRTTPLSRGHLCYRYSKTGSLIPLKGCQFTNGALASEPDSSYTNADYRACEAGDSGCPGTLLVDLGGVHAIDFVAVRGCWFSCTVEASVDRKTWIPLEPTGSYPGDVGFTGATAARWVRVTTNTIALRQVSVFAA